MYVGYLLFFHFRGNRKSEFPALANRGREEFALQLVELVDLVQARAEGVVLKE